MQGAKKGKGNIVGDKFKIIYLKKQDLKLHSAPERTRVFKP